ncbi:MAG: FimB/Mfa2 family fimbrial subunit [Bacteroides sp.]|nr:FimB/Mfa2 family fimbrial subunit [Bacteroides sp.]
MESCIREDNSDCITGLYIYFNPENPKHDYPELVQTVNLYFYDEVGDLAAGFMYNKQELYSNDKAAFIENLPQGNYTLVSIINNVETYSTVDEQQMKSLESHLRDRLVDYPLVDFFSGIKELTVKQGASQQKVTTDIFKHNNDIRVEVISDGYEPPPGATFNIYIEGNNGAYHYQSATCPEGNVIKYFPHHTEGNQNDIFMVSQFTVMRLWRNADLALYLEERVPFQGVSRTLKLNIAEELAKVVDHQNEFLYDTDEKLSFTDEYTILITLGPNFILLELVINDWTLTGGGIEI